MTKKRDYDLTGSEAQEAKRKGLVSAEWYKSNISRERLKKLMQRRNTPAIYHTLLWFTLIIISGLITFAVWGTMWIVPSLFVWGTLVTGCAAFRWHECGHGTAFRTQWMNDVVHNFSCFFLMWEPTYWRWSHSRHHTDTIIVGRDREIVAQRPPDFLDLLLAIFNLKFGILTIRRVFAHAFNKINDSEKNLIPSSQRPKLFRMARIWISIWTLIIILALATQSFLLILMFLLPQFYGHWIIMFFGVTQHGTLAEDVLDHRLNTRTIYMNPVFRFMYLNMNYHLEHHMFPMVPYYSLPALHEIIKDDCPEPYPSTWVAYKEIIPALLRQYREPMWFVNRKMPEKNQ